MVDGPASRKPKPLALVGGTLRPGPGEEPVRDGVVLVEGGKVAAVGPHGSVEIPAAAETLDCTGRTVTSGFWNSHVHFFERKWMQAAAIPALELGRQLEDALTRYGFTSVFDTGSMWENTRAIRDRVASGEVPGPRIFSTGEALLAEGAAPADVVLRLMGLASFPAPEIVDAAGAAAAARRLLDAGVDGVKVHLQAPPSPHPPFPESALAAAVGEARRSGRPAFVHPNTGADVLAALRAGADVVAHTTPSTGPWDDAIFELLKERRAALTPTLTLWKFFLRHDRVSSQEAMVATAIEQLRAWREHGGVVLFGTDLGAVDPDPSEEYALMAEAGMGFDEILASLTTEPATLFASSENGGRLRPGAPADLAVLDGDPAEDLRALTRVAWALRGGRPVFCARP